MWGYSIGSNHIGGGGGGGSVKESDVNFYDYDGTLIAGYTIAEAQALSALPSGPDHTADGLTFQEWNYTLSQVNATTSNLDVGATYITTDGKTHLYITLTTVSGLSPTLYLNKSDTSEMTIDWGDTNSETLTTSGSFNKSHTYSAAGDYVVKLWISSGSGTYGFGQTSTMNAVVGGTTDRQKHMLTKIYIGENVVKIISYSLIGCLCLSNITIPNYVTVIEGYVFQSISSLHYVVVPSAITVINSSTFAGCTSLTGISLPAGVTSINSYAFSYNSSLEHIVIPNSVTTILSNAFLNCSFLTSIIIPSGIISISEKAFNGCYSLRFFTICAIAPPTLSNTNTFSGIPYICIMRVPSDSLSAYQVASYWSTYAAYMEGY